MGLQALSDRLPLARADRHWVVYSRVGMVGYRVTFAVGGDRLMLQFTGPLGRPGQVGARYVTGPARRPLLQVLADSSCAIYGGRRLTYDAVGRPAALTDLDGALHPIGAPEPLNPPVPEGVDPPGLPVALVDSGVNYLLPEIASRLARAPNGRILGYDYRDLDRRPFDTEPIHDPFHPGHHGTRTAALLLAEAPVAKLVPYRYPRGEMHRMAALVEAAAAHKIRVMNLSMATRNRHEWLPFADAARAHPEMLYVVAAGNHGRDLETHPTYPATLDLDNMIVVTSGRDDGRLAAQANFGVEAVDLAARGEEVIALDFDGVRRGVTGSSYATARVSALAACLLADHPEWSTAELKAAVFREADGRGAGQVAHGFLADQVLGNRGACRKTVACGAASAC